MSKRHLLVERASLFTNLATACGIGIHRWRNGGYANGSLGYALDDLPEIGFQLTDIESKVTCINCRKALVYGSRRARPVPLS